MSATLYSYWRSTAAYRVRIALNLKGIDYSVESIDLKPAVAANRQPAYAALNPQRLVPFFVDDEVRIGQSLAILEYLEERYPAPALLPAERPLRTAVRAFAQHIACEVHPLNNVSVLDFLDRELGVDAAGRQRWYAHWVQRVFGALEASIDSRAMPFAFGEQPSLADVVLVPQVYNARRFEVPLDDYPGICRVEANCLALDAFSRARPEQQPDAPAS